MQYSLIFWIWDFAIFMFVSSDIYQHFPDFLKKLTQNSVFYALFTSKDGLNCYIKANVYRKVNDFQTNPHTN